MAGIERDESAKRRALGSAAVLATQLGDGPRGIALWERCVAADDHDVEALDGLVALLEGLGRNERLVEVLELRATASTSSRPERRRSDRARVARLLGDVLGRRDDAIAAWRRIEKDFGEAEDAAVALCGLIRDAERWPDLATLLRRRASSTDETTARAELLRQLGDLQREQLRTIDVAAATYAEALSADPRNGGARAGLQAIAGDGEHRARAVALLLAAVRACDDWQAVLDLTGHRLAAAGSDDERLAVLLEAADISERRAGDPGLAFEAVRRAFALAPGDERVGREIERLAGEAGAWPRLVEAYREAIDGTRREGTRRSPWPRGGGSARGRSRRTWPTGPGAAPRGVF